MQYLYIVSRIWNVTQKIFLSEDGVIITEVLFQNKCNKNRNHNHDYNFLGNTSITNI
jgi:hypothetical protein